MSAVANGLSLDDVAPIEVDFLACRAGCDRALWVGGDAAFADSGDERDVAFARRFCVGTVVLRAERYGGYGIGRNGGGSRCGNIGGYQLKGVGPNPLVGEHDRPWYSYGGLNARDAVYETIMSQVVGSLLPVGVARVYGIVLTTSDGAYCDEIGDSWTRGWGAILVREICLRPGHFLRAMDYKPRRSPGSRIPPDSTRVRQINQALYTAFPKVGALIQRLGGFLHNCASQFAFAKFVRIMHGGIAASNLCFDGRWIDLTNTSFIRGGENVGGLSSFYEEPFVIRQIIAEFIDTFSKYNGCELNPAPLLKYYDEELDAHLVYYLPVLFGMDPGTGAQALYKPDCQRLVRQVMLVLDSGKTVINGWPLVASPDDPVVRLQRGLFLSLFDPQRALEELSTLVRTAPGFSPLTAATQFGVLARVAHNACSNSIPEFYNFVRLCAVEALRRSLYAEYFYRGRLYQHIKALMDQDPFACRRLIDESIGLAEWLFKSEGIGTAYLFRSDNVSLVFDGRTGNFIMTSKRTGENLVERDAETVLRAIKQAPATDFVVQSYDFRVPLGILLQAVAQLRAPAVAALRRCGVSG